MNENFRRAVEAAVALLGVADAVPAALAAAACRGASAPLGPGAPLGGLGLEAAVTDLKPLFLVQCTEDNIF